MQPSGNKSGLLVIAWLSESLAASTCSGSAGGQHAVAWRDLPTVDTAVDELLEIMKDSQNRNSSGAFAVSAQLFCRTCASRDGDRLLEYLQAHMSPSLSPQSYYMNFEMSTYPCFLCKKLQFATL